MWRVARCGQCVGRDGMTIGKGKPDSVGRSPFLGLLLIGAFGAVVLGGWLGLTPLRWRLAQVLGRPLPLQQIHQQHRLRGQTVTLRGTVGDRVPLVGGQVYELQDASESVWVVSSDTSLQTGEAVTIKGVVQFEPIPANLLEPAPNSTAITAESTAEPTSERTESGRVFVEETTILSRN